MHSVGRIYDYSMSSFFQNYTSYDVDSRCIEVGSKITALKARALLVDMEEGVVHRVMRSHLGSVFDDAQYVTAVSGCGNNWAHGHLECGPEFRELLLEKVRRQAERCESLQSFFFLHSLGGGTGSGLGTYLLSQLQDSYPDVYRFCTAIFPSENDDVITSPYNSLFALNELKKHADCVFPMENEALLELSQRQLQQKQGHSPTSAQTSRRSTSSSSTTVISAKKLASLAAPKRGVGMSVSAVSAAINNKGNRLGVVTASSRKSKATAAASRDSAKGERDEAFAQMNAIAAQLLLDLTSSMRFKGSLNIDLNEITTNLVPFPGGLHFLSASFAPLVSLPEPRSPGQKGPLQFRQSLHDQMAIKGAARQRRLAAMFTELFSSRNQLMSVDARRRQLLAVALMARGDIQLSEIQQNVERLQTQLPMVSTVKNKWQQTNAHVPSNFFNVATRWDGIRKVSRSVFVTHLHFMLLSPC